MERSTLAKLRHGKHWTLAQAAEEMGISINTLSRWERGSQSPHGYNLSRLCDAYGVSEAELSVHTQDNTEDMNRRQTLQFLGMSGISLFTGTSRTPVWAEDMLASYTQGVAACEELHSSKSPQLERILPLYRSQITALARYPSPVQQPAAHLASQVCRLACSLATDSEDFLTAQRAGQEALEFAEVENDVNLQIAALISLANIGFHRKLSAPALYSYKQAVSLLGKQGVTPLLKGRVYAGMAEVYGMRQDRQEAMRALGLAYEWYPQECKSDPAYSYLHTSRYSLYMFGDVQTRLFLGQPKEAAKAVAAMYKESKEPQSPKPLIQLDTLYYQADIAIQQRELEASTAFLSKATALAKNLRSRLYFNKLAASYQALQSQYPKEPSVIALEEVLQPW